MNLETMIRTASALPKGSAERMHLVAALKMAVAVTTKDFIDWVLATQKPMSGSNAQTFIQTMLGRKPDPAAEVDPGAAPSVIKCLVPLEVGQKVKVDRYKNKNTQNIEACEEYHDRGGKISAITPSGVMVQFYGGTADRPSASLTQEKRLFDGFMSGSASGLYRWTPRTDVQQTQITDKGFKKHLFEVVYLAKSKTGAVDKTRLEGIQNYLNNGPNRSNVYFTGTIVGFAISKKGQMYFRLSATQRTDPVTMSPGVGKLLYIGLAGKRPKGWEIEAAKLGIGST